jgi:hypothetical protein
VGDVLEMAGGVESVWKMTVGARECDGGAGDVLEEWGGVWKECGRCGVVREVCGRSEGVCGRSERYTWGVEGCGGGVREVWRSGGGAGDALEVWGMCVRCEGCAWGVRDVREVWGWEWGVRMRVRGMYLRCEGCI